MVAATNPFAQSTMPEQNDENSDVKHNVNSRRYGSQSWLAAGGEQIPSARGHVDLVMVKILQSKELEILCRHTRIRNAFI